MLPEAMSALAEAGGAAIVKAAGTDAWQTFREAVARWFSHGEARREQLELERLARTEGALQAARPAEMERVRIRQEAAWQTRIESILEGLDGDERDWKAGQLQVLLSDYLPARDRGVSAGAGGLATSGDVTIRADHGSIAAGVLQGGYRLAPLPSRIRSRAKRTGCSQPFSYCGTCRWPYARRNCGRR